MSATVPYAARVLGSAGTTSTATITAPTPGNTLLVVVKIPTANAPITAFTDNLGNSYTQDHSDSGFYGGFTFYYFRKSNIPNAPTSLSVTGTSGSFAALFDVVESAGLDNASPVVSTIAKAHLSGGASQATHLASATTTNANDFILLAVNASNGDPATSASNGFSIVQTPVYDDLLYGVYLADAGAAGAKTTTITFGNPIQAQYLGMIYKAAPSGPTVTTVTSPGITEGGNMVFTVSLSGATSGSTNYAFNITGTATAGTDYTSPLTSGMCNNSVAVSGGNFVAPAAVSSWTVTIPTTQDALDEDNETIILTVGGTASTGGTITDNDAPPVVTFSDGVESFGVVTCVATLGAVSGKDETFDVSTANGSKTAGTNYTAIVAQTVTIPAGSLTAAITVNTL